MKIKTKLNTANWLLLVILLFFNTLRAQTTETFAIPLSNPGLEGKLNIHIVDGSITVVGHNGKDVVVKAIGHRKGSGWNNHTSDKWDKKHREESSTNRGDMKRIDDNSLEFTVEEVNNNVYVKYTPGKWVIDFEVKVPKNFSLDLKTINQGNIRVENVEGAHEVSNTNGKITMDNMGGSVIADALNKDIVISFNSIKSDAAMMFSSLNGDVDITFPKNLKANIMARSDNGNVYTDFEMEKSTDRKNIKTSNNNGVYRVKREKGVSGSINGGGPDMTFKTLNGDILIRSNQ